MAEQFKDFGAGCCVGMRMCADVVRRFLRPSSLGGRSRVKQLLSGVNLVEAREGAEETWESGSKCSRQYSCGFL